MNENEKRIVVHPRAARHIDEICAIWIMRKFGERKYPGISTAKVIFAGRGGEKYAGCSADDLEQLGFLFIGAGGGRLDEHRSLTERSGEKKKCSSMLVAEDLGIDKNPALEQILKFIEQHDSSTVSNPCHPFDLASIVKDLERKHQDKPELIIKWAMIGLNAKYQAQQDFFVSAKKEFDEKADVEQVQGPNGKKIPMVTIVSDNEQMISFARSNYGAKAGILIQQQPAKAKSGLKQGCVQIFTDKSRLKGVDFRDIVQMIRFEEDPTITDWKQLSAENVLAANWYYLKGKNGGQMLLNGSLSAPDVPPTKIALKRIKELVRIGLNPNVFEPEHASKCMKRNCTSTSKDQCPWYCWGLHRCRKIRHEMKQG